MTDLATTLATHEAVIERGLNTFVEVGAALAAIRDGRLYRDTHGTFEDYCQERWSLTRRHVNRLVAASEVVREMGPTGPIPPPTSERHARELAHVDEDDRQDVWLETNRRTNNRPTAAVVREVAREIADRVADQLPGIVDEVAEGERRITEAAARINPDRWEDRLGTQHTAAIIRAVEALTDLPDPRQAARDFPEWRRHNVTATLAAATAWLTAFTQEWNA